MKTGKVIEGNVRELVIAEAQRIFGFRISECSQDLRDSWSIPEGRIIDLLDTLEIEFGLAVSSSDNLSYQCLEDIIGHASSLTHDVRESERMLAPNPIGGFCRKKTVNQYASEVAVCKSLHLFRSVQISAFGLVALSISMVIYWTSGLRLPGIPMEFIETGDAILDRNDAYRFVSFQSGMLGGFIGGVASLFLIYIAFAKHLRWMFYFLSAYFFLSLLVFVPLIFVACAIPLKAVSEWLFCLAWLYCVFWVWIYTSAGLHCLGNARSLDSFAFYALGDPRIYSGRLTFLRRFMGLPGRSGGILSWVLGITASIGLAWSFWTLVSFAGLMPKVAYAVELSRPPTTRDYHQLILKLELESVKQLLLGVVVFVLAVLLKGFSVRYPRITEIHLDSVFKSRFVLFLRNFELDDFTVANPNYSLLSSIFCLRAGQIRIENELFAVCDGFLPLVAIGRPRDLGDQRGDLAYRRYFDNDEWKFRVVDLIERSQSVVVVMKDTKGVWFEVDEIVSRNHLMKTLFLFDPCAQDELQWEIISGSFVGILREYGVVKDGFELSSDCIGVCFSPCGEVVEILNRNWTAESYKIAFSSFLSGRVLE